MPFRNDLGVAFHTVREINVSAIREEAGRPVAIACFGAQALCARASALLREQGDPAVAPGTPNPLLHRPLTTAAVDDWRLPADMALVLLDVHTPPTAAEVAALTRLAELSLPATLVLVGEARGDYRPSHSRLARAHMITLPALDAPSAGDSLAAAIFERLPAEKRLAAARALPGLRHVYADELISSVSFANASYALAAAIPEQIPLLAAPLALADIIVLTKNQALMVYRLALAHGAAPDDHARLAELIPVIGGGFVWRQIARTAVSFVPLWGIVPKVAIAYAGTYVTGFAAWRWFVNRERLSPEHLRELTAEAMQRGRDYAQTLVDSWNQQKAAAAPRRSNPGEGKRS